MLYKLWLKEAGPGELCIRLTEPEEESPLSRAEWYCMYSRYHYLTALFKLPLSLLPLGDLTVFDQQDQVII